MKKESDLWRVQSALFPHYFPVQHNQCVLDLPLLGQPLSAKVLPCHVLLLLEMGTVAPLFVEWFLVNANIAATSSECPGAVSVSFRSGRCEFVGNAVTFCVSTLSPPSQAGQPGQGRLAQAVLSCFLRESCCLFISFVSRAVFWNKPP